MTFKTECNPNFTTQKKREESEKKREQKKCWTKKKIKVIKEVVQTMTEEEFDALPESLSETLQYLRNFGKWKRHRK